MKVKATIQALRTEIKQPGYVSKPVVATTRNNLRPLSVVEASHSGGAPLVLSQERGYGARIENLQRTMVVPCRPPLSRSSDAFTDLSAFYPPDLSD
jgi:hypothetical protein